jgi:hypothetical protein
VALQSTPLSIFSSPDGSCLLIVEEMDGQTILRAYHFSNFGSTNGIPLSLGAHTTSSCTVSSLTSRNRVYFLAMEFNTTHCRSYALNITRKVTEFSFKEKGGSKVTSNFMGHNTAHNCLVDCHAEVWTRFPVAPAIPRQVKTISSAPRQRSITLAMEGNRGAFPSYWSNLISTFERLTRKPTAKELSTITARAQSFDDCVTGILMDLPALRLGEWLMGILCLIPIHIAVTRENRFVPLKDGVWSAELERTLLGAKVEEIVDNLSFGWYESIFHSYMSTKVGFMPKINHHLFDSACSLSKWFPRWVGRLAFELLTCNSM